MTEHFLNLTKFGVICKVSIILQCLKNLFSWLLSSRSPLQEFICTSTFDGSSIRTAQVFNWFRDPSSRPELMMTAGTRCGEAPFIFPTDGLIGFIWDDSFRPGHRHQGIDIFSGTDVGVTPVIAAYPGLSHPQVRLDIHCDHPRAR